ncbi:uncharacterized protein [Miscanthus floridulus]|uniref:uncharacterized protein isoform X4 n=1 Tax=Miscanthus floridulus TaxID=154761 RepID=UPI003459D4C5
MNSTLNSNQHIMEKTVMKLALTPVMDCTTKTYTMTMETFIRKQKCSSAGLTWNTKLKIAAMKLGGFLVYNFMKSWDGVRLPPINIVVISRHALSLSKRTPGASRFHSPRTVRKTMNSSTAGLCVASAVIAITVSLTAVADPLEQDPCLVVVGFALALCMVFHGGMALVFRGVGP